MAEEGKRTIAYLCPACRHPVVMERTIFQLAAGPARLPCPCGGSAVHTEMEGDRCTFTVPCLFCGKEHTVSCSTHAVLHETCLAFSCAVSGLDCCYVGEEQAVFAATRRLEEAVDKLEASGRPSGEPDQAEKPFLDPLIMEEVLAEIRDIAARGGVSCTCGSKRWTFQVNYSSVDLQCRDCGAQMRIPAATADDLDDVCCKTRLLIRGKESK